MKTPTYCQPVGKLLTGILCLLLFMGCERTPVESEDEEPAAPTFSQIQADIFSTTCARSGCHAGSDAPQGLDLSEGNAYDNLVSVPSSEVPELDRVDPGNPDDSYLIIKLEGGDRMADGTQQMPFGQSPLSSERIQQVRDWIADGAPEN